MFNPFIDFAFVIEMPTMQYRVTYLTHALSLPSQHYRRAMMYKVFNTFIDDIFAFVIEMPTMHRIATLRDDLVFFIFLFQRYIYGVDKKRANEFGKSYEDDNDDDENDDDNVAVESVKKKVKNDSSDVDNGADATDSGLSSDIEDGDAAKDGMRKRKLGVLE
jgi:hypothetical protein